MKKLNQAWIFSDSIVGHELQSLALARALCYSHQLYHCGLRQPWLSFAPRILPGFGKNIIWEKQLKPDLDPLPEVIITTGRRMAAVGKYFKRKYNIKHIQILNPKDNPSHYDVLICPRHDDVKSDNVIEIIGSLHEYNKSKLNSLQLEWRSKIISEDKKVLSLLIGNPGKAFFKQLKDLKKTIQSQYDDYQLFISGSRRTPNHQKQRIHALFSQAKLIWFSQEDGENPYPGLISCSDVFMVTADSINMVSELCATEKPVILLAEDLISPKHKKFINSLEGRAVCLKSQLESRYKPLNSLENVVGEVFEKLTDNKQ